jgi:hypothetical protein
MRRIVIAPQQEGKGRSFEALCLASVIADGLWSGGNATTDDTRPVWAMFAGSDAEMRPFMANLTSGRKGMFLKANEYHNSRKGGDRLELLRSAGYQVTWQREPEGMIATVFLPDLFRADPGMVDPSGVRFVVLPSASWAAEQKIETAPILEHATRLGYPLTEEAFPSLVSVAFLFAVYLDRRTRCPLLSDGRFYLQLLLACLDAGYASWSGAEKYSYREKQWGRHSHHVFFEVDTADVGLLPGISFKASHEQIETILAEQVALFFQHTGGV